MFALTAAFLSVVASVSSFLGYHYIDNAFPSHVPHVVKAHSDNSSFLVRLVGGFEPFNGRLEVSFNAAYTWGGVCYDHFDWYDARAACHSLGYMDAYAQVDVVRKPNASALLANVSCPTSAEYLQQCSYTTDYPWNMTCPYNLQVFLTCHPRIGPKPTPPGPSPSPSGNTIGINVCTDPFCGSGTCNQTAVVPQGKCYSIGNNQSQMSKCVKRPGQKCAKATYYNGTCSNQTALFAQPQTCDVCSPDPYGQWGKLTDCFNGSSFVTYMYGCDSHCASCTTFKRFNQGQCTPLAGVLMSFDRVEDCEYQIGFRNYVGSSCANATGPLQMVTADRCLGQVGYAVRYTCNGVGEAVPDRAGHFHSHVGIKRQNIA